MTVKIVLKRGDTLLIEGRVKTNGVIQNITGWTIRSQVRDGPNLVAELSVTYEDRPTGFYRLRGEPTNSWPVKPLRCDIEYTTDTGQIASTETFVVQVQEDITQ